MAFWSFLTGEYERQVLERKRYDEMIERCKRYFAESAKIDDELKIEDKKREEFFEGQQWKNRRHIIIDDSEVVKTAIRYLNESKIFEGNNIMAMMENMNDELEFYIDDPALFQAIKNLARVNNGSKFFFTRYGNFILNEKEKSKMTRKEAIQKLNFIPETSDISNEIFIKRMEALGLIKFEEEKPSPIEKALYDIIMNCTDGKQALNILNGWGYKIVKA